MELSIHHVTGIAICDETYVTPGNPPESFKCRKITLRGVSGELFTIHAFTDGLVEFDISERAINSITGKSYPNVDEMPDLFINNSEG